MEGIERGSYRGISLLLGAVLTLAACQKVIDEEKPKPKPEEVQKPDEPKPGDNTTPESNIIHAGTDGVRPCGIDIDTSDKHRGIEWAPYMPGDLQRLNGDTQHWFTHSNVWFYGYAVGYINANGDSCFTASAAASDNILISDVKSGCVPNNTLLIELQDEPMQQTMSLQARPDSIGHLVRFNGATTAKGSHGSYCLQTSYRFSADWLTD